MRIGDEGVAVSEWVAGRLAGDTELAAALGLPAGGSVWDRLWMGVAPSGTGYPFVVWTVGEGVDTGAVGPGPRVMVRLPVTVRVVDEGDSYARLRVPARRVSALLDGQVNVPLSDGGLLLSCARTGTVQYEEVPPAGQSGGVFRHLGASFAVVVQ